MAGADLREAYKARLASLYPASDPIPSPDAIEVGGEAPPITVDFGIVKEDGRWRIPAAFEDLAEPLLLREAYRAGLPEKTARTPAMAHVCNWFAWRSISNAALQKKFYNAWVAASLSADPRADPYKIPPALIRELDKALDADPRELHELLVRYSAENERLLGKQLRYDAAEQWAFHKVLELAPIPPPAVVELLFAAAELFLAEREPPSRTAIIDRALRNHHFTRSPSANTFKEAFPAFSNLAFVGMQLDISLAAQRYVYAFFTPSPRATNLDWASLLGFPGMFLGIDRWQGTPMPGEGTRCPLFARFCVPSAALEDVRDYFAALEAGGLVTSWQCYHATDTWFSTNHNCYVPHPLVPSFTIDPVRDEPALSLQAAIDTAPAPARVASLLGAIAAEDIAGIQRFLQKAGSPYSLDAARHDSWLATVAGQANVSVAVARRWYDLLVHQHGFLVPEPRNAYLFVPHVAAMTRLSLVIPGSIPARARARFIASFPAAVSSSLASARDPAATYIKAFVPRRQLGRAVQLAYHEFPGARPYIDLAAPITVGNYKPIAWFDGTGYPGAAFAIQRFTAAIPNVASGSWSIARFLQAVAQAGPGAGTARVAAPSTGYLNPDKV